MKIKLLALTFAVSCAFAGNAMALTKDEYKTQKDQISADYKVNRDKCATLKANAKDICVAEAKGVEKVAKAELEAQYKPSAKNTQKIALAKGDAAYATAKEKCDDLAGNAKDVCVKDAKAALVKAKEDAKVVKAAVDTSKEKAQTMGEVKKDASAATREADYKAAKERCDSLAGAAKDTCLSDAKAKFGM
ncbi:hypothetical protein [Polaromonas sp.]|jgi:hypothetical protein|uniref:hypothetical protein n=1 Tax=Polaromonas sp. TaxID=1869339 RepID=UPI001D611D70|nr:hypothetical protein [Polaromonas sp.]MBT9474528.1 hypothetical protein [Polaromonas sp.]